MGTSWPRIIYDPVHEVIPFQDTPCDRLLLNLINTREFQRLRRIKQLGMSDMVFPGSSHTRFAHSIGVMNMARKFLRRIAEIKPRTGLTKEHETVVLVASLLHDVGHGPFSHAFEKVTKKHHEDWTLDIILDASTEVNQVLRDRDRHLPQSLQIFFLKDSPASDRAPASTAPKRPRKIDTTWQIPPYLKQVVSSQLDADRFDYLLRDSYSTGAQYGQFDADWLLSHLWLDDFNRFFLHYKSLYAAEAYVYSRYHMYQTVYFHKTTRSAEVMLKLLLARVQQHFQDHPKRARRDIAPGAPPLLLGGISHSLSLADYLLLDDYTMWEFIKACQTSSDPIISELSRGLLDRKLYKAIDVTRDGPYVWTDFESRAREALAKEGLDKLYHLRQDTASDTPYALPYAPGTLPEKQIFIGAAGEDKHELSVISDSVDVLTKAKHTTRYYFPERARVQVQKCLMESRKRAKT